MLPLSDFYSTTNFLKYVCNPLHLEVNTAQRVSRVLSGCFLYDQLSLFFFSFVFVFSTWLTHIKVFVCFSASFISMVYFCLFSSVHSNPATAPSEDDLPEQSDDDKRKKLSIQDIVDLQETSFTVRIQPPGTESFELQVLLLVPVFSKIRVTVSSFHFSSHVSPPPSGDRPDVGCGAPPGAYGSWDHLPSHVLLPPAGWCHARQP